MKLSDLKAGEHIVELRNGWRYLVLKSEHGLFLVREIGFICSLTDFDINMQNLHDNKLDICKVFEFRVSTLTDLLDNVDNEKPIWNRDEKPILHKEIEDLQALISTLNDKFENINKNLKGFSYK